MKIEKVVVEGFGCFSKRSELTLGTDSGLVFVRGENQAEPDLGANGAGKSTLFAAICWALYGKTPRKLSAGAVESWHKSKVCKVSVTVSFNGTPVVITRGRNPIVLRKDSDDVTQQVVDELLRMSYDTFLHVCLMGQFGVFFADLSPTARLTLLTEVLQLEIWTKAAEEATARLKALETQYTAAKTSLAGISGKMQGLEEARAEAQAEALAWGARHKQQQADLRASITKANVDLDAARMKLSEVQLSGDSNQKAREELSTTLRLQQDAVVAAKERHFRVKVAREQLQSEIESIEAKSKRVYDLDTCPTCLQQVTDEHVKGVSKSHREQVKEIGRKLDAALHDEHATGQSVKSATEECRKTEYALEAAKKVSAAHAIKVREQEMAVSKATNTATSLTASLKQLQAAESPYKTSEAKLAQQLASLSKEHEEKELLSAELAHSIELCAFWPKAFKELRLWMVDEALDELTINVNSSLVELGLHGWSIEFIVERETQSGSISRGFDIVIRSPQSQDASVPWEAWSGGETQRLRVAIAVGLANMIATRMPNPPLQEFWDEPTAHLSQNGVRDLIEFFKARSLSKQVWLIDHRSLDSGSFDRVVTVVKTSTGSRLET